MKSEEDILTERVTEHLARIKEIDDAYFRVSDLCTEYVKTIDEAIAKIEDALK